MKNLLVLGLLTLSAGAFAAPISCGLEGNAYRVWVNSNQKTAEVTLNGQVPQFGKLVCESSDSEGNPGEVFLSCHSPNVADAGYEAIFHYGSGLEAFVNLSEFWFGGTRPLSTLPCAIAQH